MTPDSQKIKDDWFLQAKQLLESHPERLLEFMQLWNAEKLQDAYLYVESFIKNNGISPCSDFQKADENFYWQLR
jgi:hypothetical protein